MDPQQSMTKKYIKWSLQQLPSTGASAVYSLAHCEYILPLLVGVQHSNPVSWGKATAMKWHSCNICYVKDISHVNYRSTVHLCSSVQWPARRCSSRHVHSPRVLGHAKRRGCCSESNGAGSKRLGADRSNTN